MVIKNEFSVSSCKTKLAASLARCRIKHDALSIYHILPETVRKQEQRASTLPLYAWINTGKIRYALQSSSSFIFQNPIILR